MSCQLVKLATFRMFLVLPSSGSKSLNLLGSFEKSVRRNMLQNFRFMVPCIFYIYIYIYIYIYTHTYTHTHTHTKCPTRCNTSTLILLQDHSTCFGYFPYPSSGVQKLQLTATGTTYVTLDRELCGNDR
jgi:hypothetical protein